jgi:hypothetical protein
MRLDLHHVLCRIRPRSLHIDHERLIEQARYRQAVMKDSSLIPLIGCRNHKVG